MDTFDLFSSLLYLYFQMEISRLLAVLRSICFLTFFRLVLSAQWSLLNFTQIKSLYFPSFHLSFSQMLFVGSYKETRKDAVDYQVRRLLWVNSYVNAQTNDGTKRRISLLHKGISGDAEEIRQREAAYGENAIPMKKSKSFLQLVWKALMDPTLIILEAAAVVSIAVALYNIFGTHGEVGTHNNSTSSALPFNISDGSTSLPMVDDDDNDGGDLEWIEGVAICVAVIIVVMVSAINDYGKEKKFRNLQKEVKKEHQVAVIRNGKQAVIPNDELVVGDICVLKYGDVVPADGVLLNGQDLKVDESSLTGESDHVKKNLDDDVRILSGTNVMEGTGKMVVVAVGLYSQTGIIYALLGTTGKAKKQSWVSRQLSRLKRKPKAEKEKGGENQASFTRRTSGDLDAERAVTEKVKKDGDDEFGDEDEGDEEQSVLQKKLALIALRIGKLGLIFAISTAAIIIIRFCVQKYVIEKQGWHANHVENILYGIITGITILVVAIPEGLPLAVTLTLAVSSKKMMKDHNLVRNLFACETMGCATTICSDKTGTLTTNRMTVTESYIGKKSFTAENLLPKENEIDPSVLDRLAEGIAVNSSYSTNIVPSKDGGLPAQVGNKTECALLGFARSLSYDYMDIRNKHPEESFVKVYTFNSKRKFMATVLDLKQDNMWRIHCKGAAEIILQKCESIMEADGKVSKLSENDKQEILEDVIPKMASSGLRTICVAYKDVPAGSDNVTQDEDSKSLDGFTCLAIFGIEDPVRTEVPAAIKQCQKAGVIVRMVTGDNANTARSIATKCGIITEKEGVAENAVLEGEEFNRLIRSENGHVDQDKFDSLWPNLRVLARSTPQDKHTLVSGIIHSKLSKHRDVVAVTGDGANDAPALKKAHVGFAMGIAGTDVAKEASDIIITDDNFISIVKACMWGRNIYDNICKFLQFQLTVNVAALMLAFVAACATGESPLKPVPMLFINLIQDSLASLALSTEMPTEHLLERKPYGRKANLLSRIMLRNILGQAFFQLAVTFVLVFVPVEKGLPYLGPAPPETTPKEWGIKRDTLVFNVFAFMTIFNLINSRCIHNERNVFSRLHKNYVFLVIFFGMIAAQAIVVEFAKSAFKVNGLSWEQWLLSLGAGFASLVWYQILVFVPVKLGQKVEVQDTH